MAKPVAAVIEDLEFLDGENVGAFDAAERTGFSSAEAMEKWLERHDAYDLWKSMKARDPEGAHSAQQRRQRHDTVATHPLTLLLDEAEGSTVAKHRRKAERVRTLLAELKAELDSDRERREAEAEARAEVERLNAALADAKARLKAAGSGTKSPATTFMSGPQVSEVRVWAKEHNVACPKVGRLPKAVIDAYLATNQEIAS